MHCRVIMLPGDTMNLPPVATALWLIPAVYTAHIAEEYWLDWRSWASGVSRIDLRWSEFFAVNAAFMMFAMMCAVLGAKWPAISLALPALAIINGVFFHILPTILLGRISPGVFTACLVVCPAGALAYVAAQREHLLSLRVGITSVTLGALAMLTPVAIARLRFGRGRRRMREER